MRKSLTQITAINDELANETVDSSISLDSDIYMDKDRCNTEIALLEFSNINEIREMHHSDLSGALLVDQDIQIENMQ